MQLSRLKRWVILFNVALSIFMATLDGSIVNIALPVMAEKLSANISSIQWVVTSYLLTISILLLIWGRISDMYGKKRIFAFGFIIFTLGSTLCGVSPSLGMLIFSRVLQAVGASAMMALSQGIVTSIFPPEERGKALGITGTTVAIGSLVGPSLGGLIVYAAGWHTIFLINIPIGILGTAVTFAAIPELHEKPEFKGFDYKGSVMFVASILLLFTGLLFTQDGIISASALIPILIFSITVLYFFISYEKKAEDPLINLRLFENKVFSLGLFTAFLSFVATFSTILFIPFYLQNVLKLSTRTAGLLMSFYPAATAIVAPFSGWLSDKITYRPLTVTGLIINTVTLFWLSTANTSTSFIEIAILMTVLGLGVAIFQSPNNSSIMGSVPRQQLGIAGGINALFRNLGMISGSTMSVMLFSFTTKININSLSGGSSNFDTAVFLKGFRIVLISGAVSCMLACILSMTRALKFAGKQTENTK